MKVDIYRAVGLFIGISLFGWLFIDLTEGIIWMVDKLDMIVWAIIYLGAVIGVSTYFICITISKRG